MYIVLYIYIYIHITVYMYIIICKIIYPYHIPQKLIFTIRHKYNRFYHIHFSGWYNIIFIYIYMYISYSLNNQLYWLSWLYCIFIYIYTIYIYIPYCNSLNIPWYLTNLWIHQHLQHSAAGLPWRRDVRRRSLRRERQQHSVAAQHGAVELWQEGLDEDDHGDFINTVILMIMNSIWFVYG